MKTTFRKWKQKIKTENKKQITSKFFYSFLVLVNLGFLSFDAGKKFIHFSSCQFTQF